jgi:hypothetical protein
MEFKGFIGALKRHWAPFAILTVAVVVFAGTTIVGIYNKARAKVPALPAAK